MRNTNRKICRIFSENLDYYMKLNGETRHDLAKELHINYSTLCNWLSCYSYASEDKIKLLADHFGISKYQLTENSNKQEFNSSFKLRKELAELTSQLNDEELQILITMAQQLVKKN